MYNTRATYISFGQSDGWGMTYPELCIDISISGSIPGYGLPPSVTTSHRSTPYDQTSLLVVYLPSISVSGLIHLYGSLPYMFI
jgi:hypothetical protein